MAFLDNSYSPAFTWLVAWWLFLLIGIAKGSLLVIPILAAFVICNVLAMICYLPYHYVMVYYSIIRTRHLCWKPKLLALIAAIVPMLMWPPIVVLGSVFAGVAIGFFFPIITAFTQNNPFALDVPGSYTIQLISEFHSFCRNNFPESLRQWRTEPNTQPWDFSLGQLVVGTALLLAGTVIGAVIIIPMSVLKAIPAVVRAYKVVITIYFTDGGSSQLKCVCFPIFLVVLAFIPFAAALCLAISIVYGLGGGAAAVGGYMDRHTFSYGLWAAVHYVESWDRRTNRIAFGSDSASFNYPKQPPAPLPHQD